MQLQRGEDLEWAQAPQEWFSGTAHFGGQYVPAHADDLNVLGVSFDAGARTDWHTHPAGQVIYVLEGRALVQVDGGERVEAGPGDSVHSPVIHLSITYGGATQWVDRKVTDEEYAG
jgi:quercetin dioxygenase-like cupin family protein